MAIDLRKGKITVKPEILPANLVAQSVRDMRHGDVAYIRKHFLGPSADSKNKGGYPVWVNLDGDILSETDLITPEETGGVAEAGDWYMGLVRIICAEVKRKKKARSIRGYIIDASHFNYGIDNLATHKVEPMDLDTEEVEIGPVIGFVANPTYWDKTEKILAGKDFKIAGLGRRVLLDIHAQTESDFDPGCGR